MTTQEFIAARTAKRARVIGWILVVVAAVCVWFAIDLRSDAVALRDNGERAIATVLEVVDDAKDPYVTVSFRTRAGEAVTADVTDYKSVPVPRVGDTQEVLYEPAHPARNVVDSRLGPDFGMPLFLGGCALVAIAFATLTFTRKVTWPTSR